MGKNSYILQEMNCWCPVELRRGISCQVFCKTLLAVKEVVENGFIKRMSSILGDHLLQ